MCNEIGGAVFILCFLGQWGGCTKKVKHRGLVPQQALFLATRAVLEIESLNPYDFEEIWNPLPMAFSSTKS